MIWNSIFIMTLIDCAIIGAVGYATYVFVQHREPIAALGVTGSATTMLAGVAVVAMLNLADLVAMHLLPPVVGMASAMHAMEFIHLNLSWLIMLTGVSLMVLGLVVLMRSLLPRTAWAVERMHNDAERLRTSRLEFEKRFLAVAQAVPVAVYITRRSDGRFLFANEMTSELLGIDGDPLSRSISEFYVDPGDRISLIAGVDEHGTFGPSEVRLRRTDGVELWVDLSTRFIEFDGEEAFINGLMDVTQRHLTEQKLRDSDRRFRAIADATPYPLFLARKDDGRLLYANERVRETIGFEGDVLEHYSIEMYWDPSDRLPLIEALEREGQMRNRELRHRTATGEMFWAVTSSVALEFEGQAAILTSFVDISDRKRIEAELAANRDRLEELVEERTRDLTAAQQALLRKERLATIGRVTATVSHELRNPLGTISASFEALRPDFTDDPRKARGLDRIERNIRRCSRIIDELLDYTRSREPVLERVRIDTWIADVLREQAHGDGIEFVTELDSGAELMVDSERLRQAFLNVVINAQQSMADFDGPRRQLTVSSRIVDGRLEIGLSDTGPGIAEDVRSRIFEPLFSTRSFGVGLGLPLVKEIMADHGGGIDVESRVGRGTTICLWLPMGPPD